MAKYKLTKDKQGVWVVTGLLGGGKLGPRRVFVDYSKDKLPGEAAGRIAEKINKMRSGKGLD